MNMQSATHYYYWQLSFDSGVVINQIDNNVLPKEKRIRQNRPDKRLGTPTVIRLIPRRSNLPEITQSIPAGCQPYYALRTHMEGISPQSRVYVVGYVQGRMLHATIVDPLTGAARAVQEPLGR